MHAPAPAPSSTRKTNKVEQLVARITKIESALQKHGVRLSDVENALGIEECSDEDENDGENDVFLHKDQDVRAVSEAGSDGGNDTKTTVFSSIEDSDYRQNGNVLEHEVSLSCVALFVAFPGVVMHISASVVVNKVLQMWDEEMTVRCLTCLSFANLGNAVFLSSEKYYLERKISRGWPAQVVSGIAFTAVFDFHPGQWGWMIVLVMAWCGGMAVYGARKENPEYQYPSLCKWALKCLVDALVVGGAVLGFIYAMLFVVTRMEREIVQISFTACVYPALCLFVKKVNLTRICNEDFIAREGVKGVGAIGAMLEIALNFIGVMLLFSEIESIGWGFLSAGLYMCTEVTGKAVVLYAIESVHARNTLEMAREVSLEKLRKEKLKVAYRWAYEMMAEKMLLIVAPIICYTAGVSALSPGEMGTIAGIFIFFETITDITQSYILSTYFAVPIVDVDVKPSIQTTILWAAVIVAMAQCVQMGFSTFGGGDMGMAGDATATNATLV